MCFSKFGIKNARCIAGVTHGRRNNWQELRLSSNAKKAAGSPGGLKGLNESQKNGQAVARLLDLAVHRVALEEPVVLLQFQTLSSILLVLHCVVAGNTLFAGLA